VRRFLVVGFFCLISVAGCGGGGAPSEPSDPTAISFKPNWTPLEKVASAPRRVLIPTGPPPKKVIVRELKHGHGTRLRVGDSLTVNYASFTYTGEPRERHWGKDTFTWELRPGKIVEGWVTGLAGMRVGSRRELVIPSRLAYHSGPRIYVIELRSVP
jgi:peptidylprolyl isomerase